MLIAGLGRFFIAPKRARWSARRAPTPWRRPDARALSGRRAARPGRPRSSSRRGGRARDPADPPRQAPAHMAKVGAECADCGNPDDPPRLPPGPESAARSMPLSKAPQGLLRLARRASASASFRDSWPAPPPAAMSASQFAGAARAAASRLASTALGPAGGGREEGHWGRTRDAAAVISAASIQNTAMRREKTPETECKNYTAVRHTAACARSKEPSLALRESKEHCPPCAIPGNAQDPGSAGGASPGRR